MGTMRSGFRMELSQCSVGFQSRGTVALGLLLRMTFVAYGFRIRRCKSFQDLLVFRWLMFVDASACSAFFLVEKVWELIISHLFSLTYVRKNYN